MGKAEMAKKVAEMRKQGYSKEEIADILKADLEIDRGEKLFELPNELEIGAKKARQAERKANATPRARKVDENKRFLIEHFRQSIVECGNVLEIINPERELTFEYKGVKYKLTLAVPRK